MRRSWGGKDRAPIFTWHVNLRDRDTHDLHDSEGSVCECEQPYSDYRDGQISPAMAAQREPYLPVLYPWRRERERARARESVCVPLCVGGPSSIHVITYFLPMSLRICLEARNGITIKMVTDPWLYPADSLEQRETLHQIILLCVPLNHHSFSPSLTFLGSGPLFSSSSRAACAAACLARLRLQPLPSGNSSPPAGPEL